ncbi:MAG: glycosyltransferase [Candidatus Bathyarchaeia archaeon]
MFKAFCKKTSLFKHIKDNLYVIQTFTFIPFSRINVIKRLNEVFWIILIKFYIDLFFRKNKDTVFFICTPLPFLPKFLFKGRLLIYDRWDRVYRFRGVTERVRLNDLELIRKADLVINSSKSLWKESIVYNKSSIIVRNGSNLEILQKARNLRKETNKKVIGYIGALTYWIDFDLIRKLAEARPEYEIHLIGPLMEKEIVKVLGNTRNVKFFGEIPYNELPLKLKEFDIGIIPFKINELTEAVDPIKVYEYMAAGKNVVSTNLPELYRFKDYIYIAESHEQFIRFCDEALKNPKVSSEILMKIALENTWEKRATQIETEILKRLSTQQR